MSSKLDSSYGVTESLPLFCSVFLFLGLRIAFFAVVPRLYAFCCINVWHSGQYWIPERQVR